jgi:hypothetical protein
MVILVIAAGSRARVKACAVCRAFCRCVCALRWGHVHFRFGCVRHALACALAAAVKSIAVQSLFWSAFGCAVGAGFEATFISSWFWRRAPVVFAPGVPAEGHTLGMLMRVACWWLTCEAWVYPAVILVFAVGRSAGVRRGFILWLSYPLRLGAVLVRRLAQCVVHFASACALCVAVKASKTNEILTIVMLHITWHFTHCT